jgi:hypothetical protein
MSPGKQLGGIIVGMGRKPPTSEEYERFNRLVDSVLSVPKEEIQRRQEEYLKQMEAQPVRRGPRKKASSSRDSGV